MGRVAKSSGWKKSKDMEVSGGKNPDEESILEWIVKAEKGKQFKAGGSIGGKKGLSQRRGRALAKGTG